MDFFFIGEGELATAFRFVGIDGIAVDDAASARAAFRRVTGGWVEEAGGTLPDSYPRDVRVLILTEDVSDSLGEELSEWQLSGKYPLVVDLPGLSGRNPGRKTLVDAIRDAIGVHV